MLKPPRRFGPHPMLPNPTGLAPHFLFFHEIDPDDDPGQIGPASGYDRDEDIIDADVDEDEDEDSPAGGDGDLDEDDQEPDNDALEQRRRRR